MIFSTKLIVSGAASLFAVALATGGVFLGTGVFTAADTPGQVLQESGVGPVSANSSPTARARATATKPAATRATTHAATRVTKPATKLAATRATTHAATHSGVGQVAPPAAQPLPSYHAVIPSPSVPAQPAAPQPTHHAPEPVHESPGMHAPEH